MVICETTGPAPEASKAIAIGGSKMALAPERIAVDNAFVLKKNMSSSAAATPRLNEKLKFQPVDQASPFGDTLNIQRFLASLVKLNASLIDSSELVKGNFWIV